ncbi:tyrosine-protein kinase Drl-like isoform X1, partial [Vespula maculifrons]
LEAELYYVREGVVNAYAMNFVVPVPANIADLEFSWQSLAGHPVIDFIKIVLKLAKQDLSLRKYRNRYSNGQIKLE